MAAGFRALLCCGAVLLSGATAVAAETTADTNSPRAPEVTRAGAPASSSIGFTLLGGVALPSCTGQPEACTDSFGPAPSLRALVLYQPSHSFGFGFVGQVARVHWQTTYSLYVQDGGTARVESDLTTGFAGLAGRFKFFPDHLVNPVLEFALGSGFQAQTGSNDTCNAGLLPAGQLGVGANARVSPAFSLLAIASATGGVGQGCAVMDGAPVTPFAGWGYGFHVGAAFDVGLARGGV